MSQPRSANRSRSRTASSSRSFAACFSRSSRASRRRSISTRLTAEPIPTSPDGCAAMTTSMNESHEHFRRGVELFNRGEFFEAHEELEEAMNLLEGDESDWEFYLGLLRAAVANHKLADGIIDSAILHLRAALKLLAPYPDRHRGIRLREFRGALTVQLDRLLGQNSPMPIAPRIEYLAEK